MEGKGAASVSQSVARQVWLLDSPQAGQPNRSTFRIPGRCGFAVFSPLQAAAGELLHIYIYGLTRLVGNYCVVKLSGNVSVGPVGWFSTAWGAESLLLGLGWCFTPGSCDLCFALPAQLTLLMLQARAQVSTSFMQDTDVPGQGAGWTKGIDFIAADTSQDNFFGCLGWCMG